METITADIVELGVTTEVDALEALETIEVLFNESKTLRDCRHERIGDIDYIGKATKGSLDTQAVWTIYKITLAPDGSVTSRLSALAAKWTERLTVTYS